MPRAIIVSPQGVSDAGGVERVMLYASREFAARGYRPLILDRDRLERSVMGRILLPRARGKMGLVVEALAFSLAARALWRRGDVLITNGYAAPFVRADLLFCHGSIRGFRFATQGRRLFYGPAEILEAMAGWFSRRVVAVSHRAAGEWRRMYGVFPGKVRVLPNCVDARAFAPAGCAVRQGRGNCARVLFIARLGPPKGTDRLLRLIERVATTKAPLEFVIATPTAENVAPFIDRPGIELRIGVRFSELPELYNSCDALFLPSRYEGFEMVTLEALSAGIPVIGSAVGAIAELSRRGTPGVRVVDPDDVEATLGAILDEARAWAEPARRIELHKMVAAEYGIERWGERLVRIAGVMHD